MASSVAGGVSWPLFPLFAANVWALEPLQAIRAAQGPSHLYTVVPSVQSGAFSVNTSGISARIKRGFGDGQIMAKYTL